MASEPNPAQPDGEVALKACPFCGGTRTIVTEGWDVGCNSCGALGPDGDDEAEAIAAWNQRAPIPPAPPEREAVYRAVDVFIELCATWPNEPHAFALATDHPLTVAIWAAARNGASNAE